MKHPTWNVYRWPYRDIHEAQLPKELVMVLGGTPRDQLHEVLKRLLGRGYDTGVIEVQQIHIQPKPTATDWWDEHRPSGWDGTPGSEVWA